MIQRALDQKVSYMLLPHIDSKTTGAMNEMARQFPHCCLPMMGLHPTSVKENYTEELALVEKELAEGNYCAIGEVGIDLYWDTTFQKEQEIVFRREIELAEKYSLPLVIHTRNSLEVAIEIVKDMLKGNCSDNMSPSSHDHINTSPPGVFHCFPGTVEQAEQVIKLGFYLGIGGVVTYKNSLMAKVVEAIPLEYIVLETDAPFLSPHPRRGTRNEPAFIPYIAQKIAEIKGISVDSVAEITTTNAKRLFRII